MLKQIINQEASDDAGADAKKDEASSSDSGQKSSQPASKRSASTGSGKNILSSDVQIRGTLKFANDLIIDGRIEGEVNSEGDLTVGENAQILGNINTRTVVVFGKVKGNIKVTDRCELKQNAELNGDVIAKKLSIEEGAAFLGSSTVGSPAKLSPSDGGDSPSSYSGGSSPSSEGGKPSESGGK